MKNSKLKSALKEVYIQEINSFPPEYELAKQYSFSAAFKVKVEELAQRTNRQYITLLGWAVPRTVLVLILAAVIVIPVGWLYYTGIVNLSTARLIFGMSEIALLYAFGTNVRNASRSFTRSYKTAFTDGSQEEEQPPPLDFALPVPPDGYVKTNEYRSTVSHTAEFTDSLGRKINYSRININQGVLTKIDTAGIQLTKLEINGNEAAVFVKDGATNLVWADRYYRYHITGTCSPDKLIKMAETL